MSNWISDEGAPFPLGATWNESTQDWNFAIYSKHAASVSLLLYRESDVVNPVFTYVFDYLRNKSGSVWHCRVSSVNAFEARFYAYSVGGPDAQDHSGWSRFDSGKILLDPYAKVVYFPPAFDRQAASQPAANSGKAPLGLLSSTADLFTWKNDRSPRHQSDTIIYEMHVRGFTRNPNSGVSPEKRGTFAGIMEKIPYLKDLGITVVELMPIFQFDPHDGNYWGYMPLSFFAPHHSYGSRPQACDQHNEFRTLVRALHAADIEVVLDVVYNHTAEGDENGPVYSYKGIDNSTYYLMSGVLEHPYANFSGTGNTLDCSNRYVRKMVVDSLRYWVKEMRVDGFRFDLASIFARNEDGSFNLDDPPIFGDIMSDPDLADVRLIAEPWDAAGAYQLGRSFPAAQWFQWNGRFRDDVRRFVKGDPGLVATLMQRLYGSDDLFPDDLTNAFHPYQSVNYVTAHDGFTMYDLVSYDQKHNQANGHGGTDGTDQNFSWNCGWEGDDGVPDEIMQLRHRQAKNFCCLMLLANGTPMLRAGDEFLQTQSGNNNPYNQDNEANWLDWDRLRRNQDFFRFFRSMIHFRKSHPSLGRSRFWREDVRWYGIGRDVDMDYESRTLAVYLSGKSQQDEDLYLMINSSGRDETFEIQEGKYCEWRQVFNTGLASPNDFYGLQDAPMAISSKCCVRCYSVVGWVRDRTKR